MKDYSQQHRHFFSFFLPLYGRFAYMNFSIPVKTFYFCQSLDHEKNPVPFVRIFSVCVCVFFLFSVRTHCQIGLASSIDEAWPPDRWKTMGPNLILCCVGGRRKKIRHFLSHIMGKT